MDVILMIDISGSMNGHKIAAVSDALENVKETLSDYSYNHELVRICVQVFSRDVRWYQEQPTPIEDFQWEEPFCTGMTSLGKACTSLSEFLKVGSLSDTIKMILISDGCPTDDYDEGLNNLSELNIFNTSERFAIGLGEEADISSLVKFTGDPDKVYSVTDLDKLLDCITMTIVDSPQPIPPTPPTSGTANAETDEWE